MKRRNNNNQNNQYNQYYGNGQQYYNGNNQYYNQNGQYYNQNGQYYNQNGQYYNQNQGQQQNKFGIYNQQPMNNNKKKKFNISKDLLIKIGAGLGVLLLLILIIVGFKSCNKKEPANVEYDDDGYVQVGNDTLGYVKVPSDWVKFKDVNAERGIRYSDKDGVYIVSLDALSTDEISAEEFALGTANQLQQSGIPDIKGAQVKLGNYQAYQIYGQQTTTGTWVLVYFFEAEDGNTHYVGIEGPDTENEAFKIPDTYTLKKSK